MKIGIIGYTGKMGQALINEITNNSLNDVFISVLHSRNTNERVVENMVITNDYLSFTNKCDVIIDFSRPESSLEVISYCVAHKKPIVCGTTGFTNTEMDKLRYSSKYTKIFYSANMSLGIAILSHAMQSSIKAFKKNNILPDVSILEKHHKHKIDKPSGTAIALANRVTLTCNDIHPEIVSLRYGENIGQHDVIISTNMEVLTAKFIFNQKVNKLYTMEDMIDII